MGKTRPLPILLLTLLLLATSFFDSSSANTFRNELRQDRGRSGYGQNCSNTLKCVTASWLSCQNNTCQCFRPNEMKYDETTRKCVSLTGERCRLGINQGSSGLDDLIIYTLTGCDANAHCNIEGICACNSTFFEDENGSCTPKLGHLKSCNSLPESEYEPRSGTVFQQDIQCLENLGLSCQKGQCRCEDLKSVYSESESQCVGLGGHPCINLKCSQHANCSIENICECQNYFYLNSDNSVCLPKIEPLQNCTEDVQCRQIGNQSLVCLDGFCNCDPAKSVYATARVSVHLDGNRVYNEFNGFDEESELTQCVGLVGSECVDRLCVPNAFCSYYAPFSSGRITTTTRRSYSRYYNDYDYDDRSRESRKSSGSTTPSILKDIETEREKIDHSGTCKCTPGYTKTKSQRCAVPFKSDCDSTSDCADGLICRNLKCVCPYNIQRYEDDTGTCLNQIGGPCDPSPNSTLSCQGNAYCKAINSTTKNQQGQKIAGHCVCSAGLVETTEGNCITGYGGACRRTYDCDSIAQLDCIDKKCVCPAFQEYNASVRKCVGLVGAKCSAYLQSECVNNAHCSKTIHEKFLGSCTCDEGFEENHDYTCDPVAGPGIFSVNDAVAEF